ncbi:MAG: nitroreductase family protein [Anaerolineales bacterium]|nr:nitroreductase family protein [Anaerolineales bacterium]
MADYRVLPVVLERYSPRAFDGNRAVPREALEVLLEAARWAPSAANSQPWVYLVFDSSVAEALEQARNLLDEGNRKWAVRAPVLLLACSRVRRENGKPQRYGEHDLGLANQNLLLQAHFLGLFAHPMAGFDKNQAREWFFIPNDYQPMVMIALGYPGEEADLPPEVREKDQEPRRRKPLDKIAGWGYWPEG